MDILSIIAAVAVTALVIKAIREKIADDRDHRRFIENLRRSQYQAERQADRD